MLEVTGHRAADRTIEVTGGLGWIPSADAIYPDRPHAWSCVLPQNGAMNWNQERAAALREIPPTRSTRRPSRNERQTRASTNPLKQMKAIGFLAVSLASDAWVPRVIREPLPAVVTEVQPDPGETRACPAESRARSPTAVSSVR